MDSDKVDQKEMELRRNKDFMASLDMVGEGAPIYHLDSEEKNAEKSSDNNENNSI
ncbi:hypothetical protein [Paenisporosarcina antarctica]|uniref:hypothetical protein n=1 Tax=Paenisporosarcina antarctica TaxID=417367 RepID=UPI001416F31E|nr:hypothetical protein [Paenisporosarcina antarctica]